VTIPAAAKTVGAMSASGQLRFQGGGEETMDSVGEAVSWALAALPKAPTPEQGYAAVMSVFQDAGRGLRRASDDELKKAVRDHTKWVFFEHGESIEDVLDREVAGVAALLSFSGLYSDEESMRKVARPYVQTRMSPVGWGGMMEPMTWEEIMDQGKVNEDKEDTE
jgi:hypothetical protein